MLDFHNHLLPGIDDGSPNPETSIQLTQGLLELGFTNFYCSPHIIADTHPNNPQTISQAAEKLNQFAVANNFPVNYNYIAEYMIDDVFISQINKKAPLLTFSSNKILTEFSYIQKPSHLEHVTFELQMQGFEPILAHPERYIYYHNNLPFYEYLKDLGFEFQLNLLSVTPYYGKGVQKVTQHLLKSGLYDYACTDLHHERHLEALKNFFTKESLAEFYQQYNFKNNQLLENLSSK